MMLVVFLTLVLLQNQTINGRFRIKEIKYTSNKTLLTHEKNYPYTKPCCTYQFIFRFMFN